MTEQKHTPGPRIIIKHAVDVTVPFSVVLGPDKGDGKRDTIATFTGLCRVADATLDAAAPELLEACKRAEGILNEPAVSAVAYPYGGGYLEQELAAAIAKAEGRKHGL